MGSYPRPIVPNSPDSPAVDFRAFYPYTPNEVKHRKRTTSSQLKVLEAIFKRDTKPNATLRNELALQLDMTARGVQVWFQNRRAKEKSKGRPGSKLSLSGSSSSDGFKEEDYHAIKDEGGSDSSLHDREEERDAFSGSSTSPPHLHLVTEAAELPWKNSPIEQPLDSATLPIRPPINPFVGSNDIYAQRRGSLPLHPDPCVDGPGLDPFIRRCSVDASLARLAQNPFASLARAKNSVLYGPGVGVAMPGSSSSGSSSCSNLHGPNPLRSHHQFNRLPYGYHAPRRPMPGPLPAGFASTPQHANIRRLSMDSRSARLRSQQQSLSQSPSPITPYNAAIRVSLPDQQLYALSSRPLASPIPGPLPSPGFSFGAASTPSMTSPSSGDSERNSPDTDSLRSFNFRGDEQDDDAATSYEAYSRFGSIASIATSETSSINSSYYAEIAGPAVEQRLAEERRDSCASTGFLGMLSGLDVGNHNQTFSSMDEYAFPSVADAVVTVPSVSPHHQQSEPNYPSPTSTITPTDSPHAQDASSAAGSPAVPISTSSELAFALESKPDQNARHEQYLAYGGNDQQQQQNMASDGVSYYGVQQHHQQDSHSLPHEDLTYPTSGYSEAFSGEGHHQHHHQDMYLTSVYPSGAYAEALSAAAPVVGMDNGMQSVDAFAAYT